MRLGPAGLVWGIAGDGVNAGLELSQRKYPSNYIDMRDGSGKLDSGDKWNRCLEMA
jgi:hypothetical protein